MKIPSHETSSVLNSSITEHRGISEAPAGTQQHAGSSDDLRNKHKRNKNCNRSVTELNAKYDKRSQFSGPEIREFMGIVGDFCIG